jgi:hypothetical protein
MKLLRLPTSPDAKKFGCVARFLWLWLCKVVFVFQMLASAANGMSGMGFNDNAPVQD